MHPISSHQSTAPNQEPYYSKALIIDNSLSMDHSMKLEGYGTRWDYLKKLVSLLIEDYNKTTKEGCDIWPLNGCRIQHVTSMQSLQHLTPSGGTPLITTLEKVFAAYESSIKKKPLWITVLLDGADDNFSIPPTKTYGEHTFSKWLTRNFVENKLLSENTVIDFILCTTEKKVENYYIDQVSKINANIHVLLENKINTSIEYLPWEDSLRQIAKLTDQNKTETTLAISREKEQITSNNNYTNTVMKIIIIATVVFTFYPKLAIELSQKNRL